MAAEHFYRQGFLLLLFNFIATAALEKRFSDFKRCADEECSMLLCRGKAVKDFSGPDCRFLSFKKSETIYVYYKLSGKRADLWAGSVGSNFGYFPKDLLAVNHLYTDKELEIKAEDTDFVCFDTGYDKFDTYDIDLLLGLSFKEDDGEKNVTIGKDTEKIEKETKQPEEVTEMETQTVNGDKLEELPDVADDQSASSLKPEISTLTESSSPNDEGSNTDTVTEGEEIEQQNVTESPVHIVPESSETTDRPTASEPESAPVTDSEGAQIPELKATLATTFDAVVTEDEHTTKVTPYEEEDSEDVKDHQEESKEDIPLLSFSEESTDTLDTDSLKKEEKPPSAQEDAPNTTEEKNLWTSLGDAVFSVVTGGETTGEDVSSDDEDETEEAAAEPQKTFEKTETEQLLSDPPKPPENTELPLLDPHLSNSEGQEVNETSSDPETLLFDGDAGNREVSGREDLIEQRDDALTSTDDLVHYEIKESGLSGDTVLEDDLVSIADDHQSDDETPKDDEDESEDPEVLKTDNDMQEETAEEEQLLESLPDENSTMSGHELGITKSEKDQDHSSEIKHSSDSELVDNEKPDQINDNLVTDVESDTSQATISVEEEIHEQPAVEGGEGEQDAGTEEEIHGEKEELLEDENALLSTQSGDIIPEKPTEETTRLAESAAEPEYSDDVMRLSLLKEHFSEEKMEQVENLLGLKNLYKLESMFSVLDTELKAARVSHSGAAQDVEGALENILEASENTILDEIEQMFDSREKTQDEEHGADTSSLDEETELLDDFQELAFSLRQKYSTASDSSPLATPETPLESAPDQPHLKVPEETPSIAEEMSDNMPETDQEYNLTVAEDLEEEPSKMKEEQMGWNEVPAEQDVTPEEDAEPSDGNKEDQSSLTVSDEEEKVPQSTPENELDVDVKAELKHYPSGSMEPMETVTEKPEEELGLFITGNLYMSCIFSVIKNKIMEWAIVII